MPIIDYSKRIQTKSGFEVRIWTTVALCESVKYPVRGEYKDQLGQWREGSWTLEGEYNIIIPQPDLDLINTPETHTIYINVYSDGRVLFYKNKTVAEMVKARELDNNPDLIGKTLTVSYEL